MRISELTRRAGMSQKAVFYRAAWPGRLGTPGNGCRNCDNSSLRVVAEIRDLAAAVIAPGRAAPFAGCLRVGHEHGDDRPASLPASRGSIAGIDRIIASLTARGSISPAC